MLLNDDRKTTATLRDRECAIWERKAHRNAILHRLIIKQAFINMPSTNQP